MAKHITVGGMIRSMQVRPDNVKPGKSTSAFVARNYNVNTKLVGDSVKPYRPTTTFINRTEQYEDIKEDKDEFTIGRHEESVPALDKKEKAAKKRTPSREGSQEAYDSAPEEQGAEGGDNSKEEAEESGNDSDSLKNNKTKNNGAASAVRNTFSATEH